MIVENVTSVGGSVSPPVQARLPATPSSQEVKKPVKEPDPSQVAELLQGVQKNLNILHNTDLQFTVHEASGKIQVTVIEESSGKIIREIPPSELLRLAAKFDEMVGMIFDAEG